MHILGWLWYNRGQPIANLWSTRGNECNAVITCLPAHMTLARPIALTLYREKERGPVELTCGAALQVRVNVNWRVKNTGNKAQQPFIVTEWTGDHPQLACITQYMHIRILASLIPYFLDVKPPPFFFLLSWSCVNLFCSSFKTILPFGTHGVSPGTVQRLEVMNLHSQIDFIQLLIKINNDKNQQTPNSSLVTRLFHGDQMKH